MHQPKNHPRRIVAIAVTTALAVGTVTGSALAVEYHQQAAAAQSAANAEIRSDAYVSFLTRENQRREAIVLAAAQADAAAAAATAQSVLDAAPNADAALRSALADAIALATDASTRSDLEPAAIAAAAQAATDASPAVTESQAAWQAAEDARVEAERVAEEARKAAQRANQSEATAKIVQQVAPSGVAWSTRVVNSGGQGAVDACAGGVTRWSTNIEGKAYLPIHEHCGGSPILSLSMGQMVAISGGGMDGVYQVVDSRNVSKGDSVSAAYGIGGSVLLQTCYVNSHLMRIVGVTKVG